VICQSGGVDCLETWIYEQTPSIFTYNDGIQTYTFSIYVSGKVIDQDGNVICEAGG
jgi:hypothetical protein